VPQLTSHRDDVPSGGVGELAAAYAHGSGGSMGVGFLWGAARRRRQPPCGFCPPASSTWPRSLRRRHGAWEELCRSSAGISCRHTPGASLADAGLAVVVGRRRCFPSTSSIGPGGVATRTSSGLSPPDVPQRRLRRARRMRLEVHKAAATARVLLRVVVCWYHLLPLRRLRRRRVQEMFVSVLHIDLQGFFVIFVLCEVVCAKCRNSWCSGVFVSFLSCNLMLV
jgi:hypothetical protein